MDITQLFGAAHLEFAKEYIALFETFAPASKYKKLLDVGCGEGPEEIGMLSDKGYDVTGITVIPWMLKNNPKIKLMDMQDMQFPPNSFDALYSCAVMEHVYIPWLACLELWITLRNNGIFFMIVPIPTMYKVVTHPSLLSQEQWAFILQHVGFKMLHNEVHKFRRYVPMIVIVAQKDKPKATCIQKVIDKLTKIRVGK